jgi:lysophospholipase L1-like esterase
MTTILGLGDSITVGNHGVGTPDIVASYRLHLAKYVAGLRDTAAGAALLSGVQFVGATTQSYTAPSAPTVAAMPFRGNYADPWGGFPVGVDNKHSGVGSERISQVLARAGDVTTYAPDVVVFECGTNDIAQGLYATGTTADEWADAVRDVCALLAPGACCILVDLPPLHNGTVVVADSIHVEPFCREMHARVATLRGEGLPVQLASIHRRLPIAYGFADGVHPSRRGFEVFAGSVLGALLRHLTGSQAAMTLAQQVALAPLITARVKALIPQMARTWQLQSADSTGIYAPKSSETTALAAIALGAQRAMGVSSLSTQDRTQQETALVSLVAADAVVLAQYAAAVAAGSSQSAAADAVTDEALEDAVYIALPRVWGITASQWAKP